jgi:virulence-associated protein VagC
MVYTIYTDLTAEIDSMATSEHSTTTAGVVRAKLFQNGRSQAVRLPRAFRFEGSEVSVRREGDAVILEPVRKRAWPRRYWAQVTRLKRDLELGDLPPLGGGLLDLPGDGL